MIVETASACQGCLSNCPVCVTCEDGRIVRVAGNDASEATRGQVCGNVRIAREQQSDGDRVLYPLRRANAEKARGVDPQWERITWDEALGIIADRLIDLRLRGEGHRVALAKGRSTGISDLFMKVLPDIYGTPNRFNHDSICSQAESVALGCVDGVWSSHEYDIEHARYLLLWGTDPISSNKMKGNALRVWSRVSTQAHVVCVDPRLSRTAQRSDEWHAIAPGTDGALACALAHVILVEGLWNRAFVGDFADGANRFAEGCLVSTSDAKEGSQSAFEERFTFGLVDWWNEELRFTSPEWAESVCGISADAIRTIARGFAAAGGRTVSWISPGIAMQPRGLFGSMAAHALNGLVGSLGACGGVRKLTSISLGALPPTGPFQDDVSREACAKPPCDCRRDVGFLAGKGGRIHVNGATHGIAGAVLSGKPYELDTLIAYWCNFAYSCPETDVWERALAKLPFFVCVTTHLSEMAQFADIVLPARHHMFETWGLVQSKQGCTATLALEQPCVEAPGETRSDEAAVTFGLAEKLAERGFPNLLAYCQQLVDPVTGRIPDSGEALAESAVKTLTRPLWDGASGWEAFRSAGVWNAASPANVDAPREADYGQAFATPSGRFEFSSQALRAMVEEYAQAHGLDVNQALESLGYEARGMRAWMGHFERPVRMGDEEEFPLLFTQHRSHASMEGRSANSPLFQSLKGTDPGDEPWDDVVKVHPADMERYGLADGDLVRVVSTQGAIQVHAKAWDGVRPGVVAKCYGQGHWAYGHVAALDFEHAVPRGGNNNEIVPAVWERVSASTARHGGFVRVRLEKVEEGCGGLAELEVSAAKAADLIAQETNVLVIDVRNRQAYDNGHIDGALWNMMSTFDWDRLPANLSFDTPIVVYCFIGWASLRVVEWLRAAGYARAYSVRGGMAALKSYM